MNRLTSLFLHIKHHWLTFAFVGGFVLDNLTLNRVDQLFDNLILLAYVLMAATSLALLYAGSADKLPQALRHIVLTYMPLAVQFSFGGLLSGMLVFYSRSGSWYTSWPFLLLIFFVIVGNEFLRDRVQKLIFNLIVFFIGLFSYLVLVIPVLTKSMGVGIFVGSGVAALVLFFLYVKLLKCIVPKFIALHERGIIFSIGMVFATLNFLYFANIIPPIPLSLKHLGVYHDVKRTTKGDYVLTYEKGAWYEFWKQSDTTYHHEPGGKVFCYASVFAPTEFNTTIFHRWEMYDEKSGEWVTKSRLEYRIEGGGDGGFRGYTYKENVEPGVWRCGVETARGQVLGRDRFTIVEGIPTRALTQIIE